MVSDFAGKMIGQSAIKCKTGETEESASPRLEHICKIRLNLIVLLLIRSSFFDLHAVYDSAADSEASAHTGAEAI